MTEYEIVWRPPDNLVAAVGRLLDENGGYYIGSRERLCKVLNLDCTPARLSARLNKAKPVLAEHGITYRVSRKLGGIILECRGREDRE